MTKSYVELPKESSFSEEPEPEQALISAKSNDANLISHQSMPGRKLKSHVKILPNLGMKASLSFKAVNVFTPMTKELVSTSQVKKQEEI